VIKLIAIVRLEKSYYSFPLCKIAEKAVYRSIFLTICYCILSAGKTHSFRLFFLAIVHTGLYVSMGRLLVIFGLKIPFSFPWP